MKIIYKINFCKLENFKVEWSGADSISQNFSFQVKIRECISHLNVGIYSIIYNSEPPIHPSTILFGQQYI